MDSGVIEDSAVPPVDANPCAGNGLVRLCLAALPREPLVVDIDREIDTDRDSRCASFTPSGPGVPANPGWCVVASTTLTIARNATLSATGARALVLVALESAQIDGTLDVSSRTRLPRRRGAGSQPNDCAGAAGGNGQGGGAGGSFTSRGGNGGAAPTAQTGNGGISGNAVQVNRLRGGCRGGNGGFVDPLFGGEPGEGGGAVYVLAPAITIAATGVVNASGAGGFSISDSHMAAGGGGSGGMIGLEASTLALRAGARVFANGGGGGEGSGCGGGGSRQGANGQDPVSPAVAAIGGRTEPEGGNGGNGAISNIAGEAGASGITCSGGSGGGGGGGGVGAVVLRGTVTDQGAQISPPPMTM